MTVTRVVLPNAGPYHLVTFCLNDDGTITTWTEPLVGWLVEYLEPKPFDFVGDLDRDVLAQPIALMNAAPNLVRVIAQPDGTYIDAGLEAVYPNFEAARAAAERTLSTTRRRST